jgi:hypothetical protein
MPAPVRASRITITTRAPGARDADCPHAVEPNTQPARTDVIAAMTRPPRPLRPSPSNAWPPRGALWQFVDRRQWDTRQSEMDRCLHGRAETRDLTTAASAETFSTCTDGKTATILPSQASSDAKLLVVRPHPGARGDHRGVAIPPALPRARTRRLPHAADDLSDDRGEQQSSENPGPIYALNLADMATEVYSKSARWRLAAVLPWR